MQDHAGRIMTDVGACPWNIAGDDDCQVHERGAGKAGEAKAWVRQQLGQHGDHGKKQVG